MKGKLQYRQTENFPVFFRFFFSSLLFSPFRPIPLAHPHCPTAGAPQELGAARGFWGRELLTGEDGGHEGGEHEEEHGEEEEAGVVEDLARVVADVQVEQPDEHPDADVGHEPQVGQHLQAWGGSAWQGCTPKTSQGSSGQPMELLAAASPSNPNPEPWPGLTVSLRMQMKVLLKRMQN